MIKTKSPLHMVEEKLVADFVMFLLERQKTESSALVALRKKTMALFEEKGFPTKKDELWKYGTHEKLLKEGLYPLLQKEGLQLSHNKDLLANECTFFNGYSTHVPTTDIEIQSISQYMQQEEGAFMTILEKLLDKKYSSALPFLNFAFVQDGAYIAVPRDKSMIEPISLTYQQQCIGKEMLFVQPLNIVHVRKGGKVQIELSVKNESDGASFTNMVTYCFVEEGANLDLQMMQTDHKSSLLHHLIIDQEKDSAVQTYTVTTGGQYVRNDIKGTLLASGAHLSMYGLQHMAASDHVENYSRVNHEAPFTTSEQLYKGLYAEKSRGTFYGSIYVSEKAHNAKADQLNKNILLSTEARVDTQPQLEIFTDEVQCSHGATVGQLDPDALFYLKGRGIGEQKAKNLLTYGFVKEVLERIPILTFKKEIDALLSEKLHLS